ncbi:MAG: acyl-CoA dehydrogenase [Novosphingobium sp.]|nr:acyl-CoA dehydrogenase [Novosphingobium sp.]
MYDLLLNQDESMIAESVREFLEAELPVERLRPNAKPIDYEAAWQSMAGLGWLGVGLPEQVGGAGLGLVEEMLILRECGRQLVSPKLLATMLAGHVAHHAGSNELATSFATGTAGAALAIDTEARGTGESRAVLTLDWNGSDSLLFWNEDGMGLFDAGSLSSAAEADCVDGSVTLHSASLATGLATAWVDAAEASLPRRAEVLLAAALVGLAEHACDLAVDYAILREQFGKPIGSFQAVKHRCADMAVRQRLAWHQTCMAALKLEAGAADAPLQVASAKLLAAEAAQENGRACIQIHGGIGFQAECDAHWFIKRAMIYDQAGGSMQLQSERVINQPMPQW